METLSEFMTRDVVTATARTPLDEAYGMMIRLGIRHLPVLEGDEIVGILSDRDARRALETEVSEDVGRKVMMDQVKCGLRVRDFMSSPVHEVLPVTSIGEAAAIMRTEKISALLVTEGRRLLGIVTTDDMLRIVETLDDDMVDENDMSDGRDNKTRVMEEVGAGVSRFTQASPVAAILSELSSSGI